MANKTINLTIVDPTAANPSALAPGELVQLQRGPNGAMQIVYTYTGGAAVVEQVLPVPPGSQAETRLLNLLSTVRTAVWT